MVLTAFGIAIVVLTALGIVVVTPKFLRLLSRFIPRIY
jgi:hypothetical protein